jgi:predicted dehydrogenase
VSEFSSLVIGLGQIGLGYDLNLDPARYVHSHARALSLHSRFRLIGGVDPDDARRASLENAYGVPAFAGLSSVPPALSPEVVVIAAATEAHESLVAEVLARWRPRAILCEKPLAYDLSQARSIVESCERAGVPLFVNYMRRADPAVIEIRRRIDAGEIAPPFKAVVWYSKGFLHSASHFLNLLAYWFGDADGGVVVDSGRRWGANDREPDARISFPTGSAVFLAVPDEAFSHHTVEVLAKNGRLRYDRGGEDIRWQAIAPHPRVAGHTILADAAEAIPSGMDRFQVNVVKQLAAALEGRDYHLCSGRQALTTLERMHSLLDGQAT